MRELQLLAPFGPQATLVRTDRFRCNRIDVPATLELPLDLRGRTPQLLDRSERVPLPLSARLQCARADHDRPGACEGLRFEIFEGSHADFPGTETVRVGRRSRNDEGSERRYDPGKNLETREFLEAPGRTWGHKSSIDFAHRTESGELHFGSGHGQHGVVGLLLDRESQAACNPHPLRIRTGSNRNRDSGSGRERSRCLFRSSRPPLGS